MPTAQAFLHKLNRDDLDIRPPATITGDTKEDIRTEVRDRLHLVIIQAVMSAYKEHMVLLRQHGQSLRHVLSIMLDGETSKTVSLLWDDGTSEDIAVDVSFDAVNRTAKHLVPPDLVGYLFGRN